MNLRNIFHRGQGTTTPVNPPQNQEEAQPHAQAVPQQLTVPEIGGSNGSSHIQTISPWIVRDPQTFSQEKTEMGHSWPQFRLEVIDDVGSLYHGATCWSGKLVPGVMDDMEWEILVIYQGIGSAQGDWSGSIIIYFLDPQSSQIKETLGYEPPCFLRDEEGTLVLSNIRPILLSGCTAVKAVNLAYRICQTIERMCSGELSEDILRDNSYLQNWDRYNSTETPIDDNDNSNISDQTPPDCIPATPPAF